MNFDPLLAPIQRADGVASINEDVQRLMSLWRTEVHAPEILPYKATLIGNISTSSRPYNRDKSNI
jgi:hypothetical protein